MDLSDEASIIGCSRLFLLPKVRPLFIQAKNKAVGMVNEIRQWVYGLDLVLCSGHWTPPNKAVLPEPAGIWTAEAEDPIGYYRRSFNREARVKRESSQVQMTQLIF